MDDSRKAGLLSVVVPFHDVERYFRACLESLAHQRVEDLEVVLVDDGSTDGSRAIAEEFCAGDPRFRVVGQDNQGPGPARNLGVLHARGEYLAFADADDVVERRGYERLLAQLTASDSDFAIGRAARFTNLGVTPSMVHQVAITEPLVGTRIGVRPELVLDRMVWNTVYRRSFWDSAGLEFARAMMQDFPLSMQAHVAATAVDVIDDVVYFWRERDGGAPSLTQRSAQPDHLHDRYLTAGMVLDVITPTAPESLPLLRRHLLEVDVTVMTLALATLPGADADVCLQQAQQLLDRLGPEAEASSSPFYRVLAAHVRAGDRDGLAALHGHAHRFGKTGPLEARGWPRPRYYEALPGFRARAPRTAYELPGGRPTVRATLEDASWSDDGTLEARILLDAGLRLGGRARVRVWLEGPRGDRTECPAHLTERQRPFLGSDLVEVRARLDPAALPEPRRPGFRVLRVGVTAPGTEAELSVGGCRGRARYLEDRSLTGGLVVRPEQRTEGFGLAVNPQRAVLTGWSVDEGTMRLAGTLRSRPGEVGPKSPDSARITVSGRAGLVLSSPVLLEPVEGGVGFVGWIPAADLAQGPEHLAATASQTVYSVRLETDTDTRPLVVATGTPDVGEVVGHRWIRATRNVAGNLELVESRSAPLLRDVRWTGPTTLRFEGEWQGQATLPAEAWCQHYEHPTDAIGLALAVSAEGASYAYEVDIADLLRLAGDHRDAYEGRDPDPWHLLLPFPDHVATQVFDRTRVSGFAEPRIIEGHRVQLLLARDDVVRIGIGG